MDIRTILYVVSFIALLFSCKEPVETKFDKEGISLTCPKGWAITEENTVDSSGYYLTLEKDGFNSSGVVTITRLNNRLEPSDWLDIYKEHLSSNIIYKNSNLTFGEQHEDNFNNISTLATTFQVSVMGINHEGIIHAFNDEDKTFAILKQEAVEDREKNRKGFEVIEKSFVVK